MQPSGGQPAVGGRRLEAVRLATSCLLGKGDWEAVAPRVLENLGRAAGACRASLYRNQPVGGGMPGARLLHEWTEGDGDRVTDLVWSVGGVSAWAAKLREGEVVRSAGEDSPAPEAWKASAVLAAGIFAGKDWWGVLAFTWGEEGGGWSQGDLSVVRTAAELFGAAVRIGVEEGESVLQSMAVESAGECIMITDPVGLVRYVNPTFERVTGYKREEVVGQSIRILESGEHPPEFYAAQWDALSRGEDWSGRFINRRKDGTLYQQDTSIVSVKDSQGRVRDFVGVGRDVTQEVALEAQLRRAQKLESLGLLASGIAHDFNNVMGLVLGATERLKEVGAEAGRLEHYLDIILDAVRRGQSVSRRMLAFYRDRDSKSEVFDLRSLLMELMDVGKHTFPRDIQVTLDCTRPRTVVRGDRSQIHQSLMNLCINAVSAMPSGGRLTLSCRDAFEGEPARHLAEPKGKYVCASVADTGTGMAAETVEKIFDPYFTTKATGEGTGLGLSIVFAIVQAQGGWVHVESTPGVGSTFTMGLSSSWEELEKSAPESLGEAPRGAGEGILVVDDEEGIRELLREALEGQGYRVLEADDGQSALAAFLERPEDVDVVVTDLGMARMGGAELVRQLRAEKEDLGIVVTTGYMDPGLPERFEKMGVRDVITKPFHMVEVLWVVARVLGRETG